MRNVGFIGTVLASAYLLSGVVSAATAALDGTHWSITVTPDAAAKQAGEKRSKDTLIVKSGQLTSTACVK